MKAEIGMYRSGAITGSKIRFKGSKEPMSTPKGSASAEARKKASAMRRVLDFAPAVQVALKDAFGNVVATRAGGRPVARPGARARRT